MKSGTPANRINPRQMWLGGICWVATAEFFLAQLIAQIGWGRSYSLIRNEISDLGVTKSGIVHVGSYTAYANSPLHVVMNASFIITGLLMGAGLYLTRSMWPDRRLARWGFGFMALASFAKVLVGLAPENVNPGLHELGSLGIVCANAGMLLFGLAVSRMEHRWMRALSLACSAAGLIGLVLFVSLSNARGLSERIGDYPTFVWLITIGYSVRRKRLSLQHDQDARAGYSN